MLRAAILTVFGVRACFPRFSSVRRLAGTGADRVTLDSQASAMEALAVALDAADDGGPWFVSRLELQLVSLALCEACRSLRISRVEVSSVTPRSLYVDGGKWHPRVPALRPYAVTWKLPPLSLEASGNRLSGLKSLAIAGAELSQGVEGVVWPRSLERLVLGDGFNQAVDELVLPASLFELEFGNDFNRAIDGAPWPPRLRRLKFGHRFDHPVVGVPWPITLRHLSFGNSFFQPVGGAAWPSSLRSLTFAWDISGAIDHLGWPGCLRILHLGDGFNKEIESVAWPATLEEMAFGRSFNQAIAEVTWPQSLRSLTFEGSFLTPANDVAWPPSLRELGFGPHFYQSLQEVRAWPENLECLSLKLSELYLYMFSLDGLTWPPRLKTLTLSSGIRSEVAPMAGIEVRYVTLVLRGIGICRELVWERVEESPSGPDGVAHNRSRDVASVASSRSQAD